MRRRITGELLGQMIQETRDESLISVITCAATQLGVVLPDALDPTAVRVTLDCGMLIRLTNGGGREGSVLVERPSGRSISLFLPAHGTRALRLGEPGSVRALVGGEVVWAGMVADSACRH